VLQLLQGRSLIRALGLGVSLALAATCLAALACGAGRRAAPASPGEMTESGPDDAYVEIEELDRDISAELARAQISPPPATCSGPRCVSEMSEPFANPRSDPSCHPKPSDHCSEMCTLATAICRNQERICKLAQQLPGEWAANKCTQARASCQAAHDGCCGCMKQRLQPNIPL